MPEPDFSHLPYRRNVGAALFNARGKILVARRANFEGDSGAWQLPQGGIDEDEDPAAAILRELSEEIGSANAEIIGEHPDWMSYDLPAELIGRAFKGRYRGQRQKWFALKFLGDDSDIRLDADPHPEFDAWRWADLAELPGLAVGFKRPIYETLARDFACYANFCRQGDRTMLTLTASDGHKFGAFEAGNVNAPRGLVVVQEIFGVNGHMRAVSERLAGFGYRVLSPALFDRAEPGAELGYTPDDVQKGLALRGKIADADVMADIEATAAAFGDKPVGIIGYCWGGSLAWWGATRTKKFKAAVGWYGGGIFASKDEIPGCPVQLHFGAEDHGIPLDQVDAIKAAHPEVPVFVYEGAGHGFGCEERASYSGKDCELAELRSLAFFAAHLR